jgi:hypothetical protein
MGNLPRSPCAPVGASWPALNGRGCASPLSRVGLYHGGSVASSLSGSSLAGDVVSPLRQTSALKSKPAVPKAADASGVTALSVEFVAKPEKARSAPAAIPAAITGAFRDVTGFAGCLVMVSAQEARLVTVVTLWAGNDGEKYRDKNLRWVQALLAPFVDHCLRAQTLVVHGPALSLLPRETNAAGASSIKEDFASPDEENVCGA